MSYWDAKQLQLSQTMAIYTFGHILRLPHITRLGIVALIATATLRFPLEYAVIAAQRSGSGYGSGSHCLSSSTSWRWHLDRPPIMAAHKTSAPLVINPPEFPVPNMGDTPNVDIHTSAFCGVLDSDAPFWNAVAVVFYWIEVIGPKSGILAPAALACQPWRGGELSVLVEEYRERLEEERVKRNKHARR